MSDSAPSPELLRSLGRLVRGLSVLFWGLPVMLVVCVQTAQTGAFHLLGLFLPTAVMGWLLYGLWELGHFQRQERVWSNTLAQTRLLAIVNAGLAPFLYWWNRLPGEPFFIFMVLLLVVSALFFLRGLNLVLRRLTAMLPDETLRAETRLFTHLNRALLLTTLLLGLAYVVLSQTPALPQNIVIGLSVVEQEGFWLVVFLVLLPVAMTMALLWKTKETILDSIFALGK